MFSLGTPGIEECLFTCYAELKSLLVSILHPEMFFFYAEDPDTVMIPYPAFLFLTQLRLIGFSDSLQKGDMQKVKK